MKLSDRMWAALSQVHKYKTYEGYIPQCEALVRRGLMRWEHGRPIFEGFVLTDAGVAAMEPSGPQRNPAPSPEGRG